MMYSTDGEIFEWDDPKEAAADFAHSLNARVGAHVEIYGGEEVDVKAERIAPDVQGQIIDHIADIIDPEYIEVYMDKLAKAPLQQSFVNWLEKELLALGLVPTFKAIENVIPLLYKVVSVNPLKVEQVCSSNSSQK